MSIHLRTWIIFLHQTRYALCASAHSGRCTMRGDKLCYSILCRNCACHQLGSWLADLDARTFRWRGVGKGKTWLTDSVKFALFESGTTDDQSGTKSFTSVRNLLELGTLKNASSIPLRRNIENNCDDDVTPEHTQTPIHTWRVTPLKRWNGSRGGNNS